MQWAGQIKDLTEDIAMDQMMMVNALRQAEQPSSGQDRTRQCTQQAGMAMQRYVRQNPSATKEEVESVRQEAFNSCMMS